MGAVQTRQRPGLDPWLELVYCRGESDSSWCGDVDVGRCTAHRKGVPYSKAVPDVSSNVVTEVVSPVSEPHPRSTFIMLQDDVGSGWPLHVQCHVANEVIVYLRAVFKEESVPKNVKGHIVFVSCTTSSMENNSTINTVVDCTIPDLANC